MAPSPSAERSSSPTTRLSDCPRSCASATSVSVGFGVKSPGRFATAMRPSSPAAADKRDLRRGRRARPARSVRAASRNVLWSRCRPSSSTRSTRRPPISPRRSTASPRRSTRARAGVTLLGATGTGKTMTMAATIERLQRPALDARAQQDARGPALQRVPDLLPAQLGRVLRLVLRLLPARGVRPVARPLHREGLGDQPGDRPAPPRRDRLAVRPARRRDRRLGLGDLRPRLARDLQRELPGAGQGRQRRPRRAPAQARLAPVQPQRPGAGPRHVPRPRRHAGGLPRLRGDRVPRDAVRRRGRAAAALRPAHGRADPRRHRARRRLAGHPLQRRGGQARGRGGRDRPRAQRPLRRARGAGQAARVAPPAPAHAVRHGDAARGRLLLRHRELLAHPRRPRRPARARTA